jgi:hypothetical protein
MYNNMATLRLIELLIKLNIKTAREKPLSESFSTDVIMRSTYMKLISSIEKDLYDINNVQTRGRY